MSDSNYLLARIRQMQIQEQATMQLDSSFFHNEDMYALFIATVNIAAENARKVHINEVIYCPIQSYNVPEYTMDYNGNRFVVQSKPQSIDSQWGFRSAAMLSNKYSIIHLMVDQYGDKVEYATLLRGFDEYLPLTPANYVPEIFKEIPDTLLFWEKDSIDPNYDVDKEMDKLFNQLPHYIQRQPGTLMHMMGHNNFGMKTDE